MSDKKSKRLRRARKTRARIKLQRKHRLCVHRTLQHIYAQVISPDGGQTITSASTNEAEIRRQITYGGNQQAARLVGAAIAQRAIANNIEALAFDRSGHKYHGRIKALADAAREAGLQI